MNKRPRDRQRDKLYTGQHSCPKGKTFKTLEEKKAYVDKIMTSRFVASKFIFADSYFAKFPVNARAIKVEENGRLRSYAGKAYAGLLKIEFEKGETSQRTIIHEVAHLIRHRDMPEKGAGHGREYAYAYAMLVQEFMGWDAYEALIAGFKVQGVKWRKKRTLSPERREALKKRGLELAAQKYGKKYLVVNQVTQPKPSAVVYSGGRAW